MSDSESSCGLEMISSRLQRETQRKQLHEKRLADPIFSSIGQLGKWQFKLIFYLSLMKFPATLIEITGKFFIPTTINEELHNNNTPLIKSIDLLNFEQIIFSIGVILGFLVFGISGDIHGRKPCLTIALLIQAISNIICTCIPLSMIFYIFYFIANFSSGGVLILTFILVMEFVGPERKELVIVLYSIPTGLSYFIFSTVSKYTLQNFISIMSVPLIIFICLLFLIPESPQWFFMMGSINRTTDILVNAAKQNELSYNHIMDIIIEAQKRKQTILLSSSSSTTTTTTTKTTTTSSLLASRGFLNFIKTIFENNNSKSNIRLLCLTINWILLDLYMHGEPLSIFLNYNDNDNDNNNLNIDNIDYDDNNSLFIKITIYSISFIIGIIISYPILKFLNNKISIICINLIITFSILLTIIIPKNFEWIKIILSLIAIINTGTLYTLCYIYAIQLFNIQYHCTYLGLLNAFGRIGSILIHFILIKLQKQSIQWYAPVIYGLLSIITNAMIICLPDTNIIYKKFNNLTITRTKTKTNETTNNNNNINKNTKMDLLNEVEENL